MILRAEGVRFGYHIDQPVLRGITLELCPGRVTALLGPNGCGKSTLLRCLNTSLRPQGGRILLDDRDVMAMAPREIARHIAVVPQDTPTDVPFTVRQMIMLGRYAHWDTWGQEIADDRCVIQRCLERMDITSLAGRLFSELSGGERQRVILARALAQQGTVLLLDEPTSHLDIAHQLEFYRMVRELATEGQAVLMVCHDIFVAPMFVDVAILMVDGNLLSCGSADKVLSEQNIAAAYGVRAQISRTGEASFQAQFK